ncbi:MAG: hypothetical protein P1V20_16355 [Verrucomicrobiales bacterium]|nr:hypothetical protein [Verrucomicrobiales bacterium]
MDSERLNYLPGYELVSKGLSDLAEGRFDSVEALLIAIGRPRLLRLGFDLPYQFPKQPELALYHHLGAVYGNAAHSKYYALIRRIVSFARALEGRQFREGT